MLKKSLVSITFILMCFVGIAQKNINNYKYVIVPKTFKFLQSEDQYQLNSLTKFLFNKYGYEAYFLNDDLPQDLKNDRCLALTADVIKDKGGMFKTKTSIVLKDCFGAVVMTSQIGESRQKEYNKAYNEAIRQAFKTYQDLEYKYIPEENTIIATPKTETITLKEKDIKNVKAAEVLVIKEDLTQTEEVIVEDIEISKTEEELVKVETAELYYAQVTNNGYQLVNSEPKIVMVLLTTAAENVFIVKGKSAIVFKEDGFWYYSENDGKQGEKKLLDIKF